MLDVGPSSAAARDEENADLAVFVDRIAAAGSDTTTAKAKAAIHRSIAAGFAPPGLRKLAEGLAASVGPQPPLPRHPAEDAGSIVSAVRSDALVVLDGFDAAALATSVAAIVADGRRVVVTAPTAEQLSAIRDELPGAAFGRSLERFPEILPREVRELRRLVATSTPSRRARGGQQFAPPHLFPPVDTVAELVARAATVAPDAGQGHGVVPSVLAGLTTARRDAVISVATCVNRSLGALNPRSQWDWAWSLLDDLVHGQHRAAFDRMLEDTAQAVAALERSRGAVPAEIIGPLPPEALDMLHRFREFLQSGGRARSYFRSAAQRDVQPVLRLLRVGGRTPETVEDVTRAIEHLELGQRLARVDAGCAELAVSAPLGEDDLLQLTEGLVKVSAAVRSVSALKHDVLFIADSSPLSVPDAETAEQLSVAILDYSRNGSGAEAAAQLRRMAEEVAALVPATARSAEHERAAAALRDRDVAGYVAAVESLAAARREATDGARESELVAKLAERTPMLADAWRRHSRTDSGGLGFAAFLRIDALLGELPPPDSADVVVVVGASGLGVERLLLGAVAPRIVAVVEPGGRAEVSPSMLSVLQRASALVIRGRTESHQGRIVRLDPAERQRGIPEQSAVRQAGAS